MSEVIQLGNCMTKGKRENPNQGRVYDKNGLSPCLTSMAGGNLQPMIIDEPNFQPNYLIVGMRGRNPDKPSDRTPGIELEQRLEPNSEDICNTLTTVQKDNLVLEEKNIQVENYRIRKLTPRECFRLMNVEEEQFNRAEKVVSKTQLYKIAGNAIVVSVLCALFSQLNIQGIKTWNELKDEERYKIVNKGCVRNSSYSSPKPCGV